SAAGDDLRGSAAEIGTVLTRLQRLEMVLLPFAHEHRAVRGARIASPLAVGARFSAGLGHRRVLDLGGTTLCRVIRRRLQPCSQSAKSHDSNRQTGDQNSALSTHDSLLKQTW